MTPCSIKRLGAAALALAGSAVLSGPAVARAPACCRAPAGAGVMVELAEPVSTRTQKTGDHFAIRLAAPLVVGGRVLLREGASGQGEVIEASKPGFGGKAAKLVLAADYLQQGNRRIALRGLQLAAGGKGNVEAAEAIGLTGIVLGPIGFVGMAVQGGNVDFPAGTKASAELAATTTLASLGRPTRAERTLLADDARDQAVQAGPIEVPAPPKGMGQIVFFRSHSLLGTAQWFRVREQGQPLGKLTNGAYFVQTETPGLHTFTATEEPEFKDSLKLQVDPGETYYVEGILTKGVVLGAADLTPSTRAVFEKAAKGMKPAPTAIASASPSAPPQSTSDTPAR